MDELREGIEYAVRGVDVHVASNMSDVGEMNKGLVVVSVNCGIWDLTL